RVGRRHGGDRSKGALDDGGRLGVGGVVVERLLHRVGRQRVTVGEDDVVVQRERIGEPVRGDLPLLGQQRLELAVVVDLPQGLVAVVEQRVGDGSAAPRGVVERAGRQGLADGRLGGAAARRAARRGAGAPGRGGGGGGPAGRRGGARAGFVVA